MSRHLSRETAIKPLAVHADSDSEINIWLRKPTRIYPRAKNIVKEILRAVAISLACAIGCVGFVIMVIFGAVMAMS